LQVVQLPITIVRCERRWEWEGACIFCYYSRLCI